MQQQGKIKYSLPSQACCSLNHDTVNFFISYSRVLTKSSNCYWKCDRNPGCRYVFNGLHKKIVQVIKYLSTPALLCFKDYSKFIGLWMTFLSQTLWTLRVLYTWTKTLLVSAYILKCCNFLDLGITRVLEVFGVISLIKFTQPEYAVIDMMCMPSVHSNITLLLLSWTLSIVSSTGSWAFEILKFSQIISLIVLLKNKVYCLQIVL